MSKILIFQHIVPEYRIAVFRKMHIRFGAVLCHSRQQHTSKIDSAFQNIEYQNEMIPIQARWGITQKVVPVLKKHKPQIVITGVAATYLTYLKLIILRKFFRYKLIAWGHGVTNREINKPLAGFRGILMRWYLNRADAVILYSGYRKDLIQKAMPKLKSRLFVAWNTLDTDLLKATYDTLQKKGKEKIKTDLGQKFGSTFNLIFIGRFLPDKGIDLLLESFNLVVQELDCALHFIGKGECESLIAGHPLFGKSIFIHGAIYDDEITAGYLFVSDLFVMPGYIGLSVVHAFSMGIPVLTCKPGNKGPFHSPEYEYLTDNENGLLPEADAEQIADKIIQYCKSESMQERMSKNASQTIYNKFTLENMMSGFEDAIAYVSADK